jgi:hypothetical protein
VICLDPALRHKLPAKHRKRALVLMHLIKASRKWQRVLNKVEKMPSDQKSVMSRDGAQISDQLSSIQRKERGTPFYTEAATREATIARAIAKHERYGI